MNGALEVVRHQQPRRRAPKLEHAHVGANPVRQRLRPGRLGIGQAGRPKYGDEDLRRAYHARDRVGDRHQLAGVVEMILLRMAQRGEVDARRHPNVESNPP